MRKMLLLASTALVLATPAFAADIPDYAPPPAPEPLPVVYDWTGFHIGGHIGYGWSSNDWTLIRNANPNNPGGRIGSVIASHDADGFLGGVQAGYSFQFDQFVLGVEGQFSWTGMDGLSTWTGGGHQNCPCYRDAKTDYNWIATLALRAGMAFDRTLLYGKVGGAWADVDYSHTGGGGQRRFFTGDSTRSGWMVGVGVEHAWLDNVSVKLEYNYMDFGSRTLTLTDGERMPMFSIDSDAHVLKGGLNYRFATY